MGLSGWVRADPNTLTAGPTSERVPNPSTNSDWMRNTRQGSECTQSVGPLLCRRSWSWVTQGWVLTSRRMAGPWTRYFLFRTTTSLTRPEAETERPGQLSHLANPSRHEYRSDIGQNSSSAWAFPGSPGP